MAIDAAFTDLPTVSSIDDTDLLALAQDIATTPINRSSTISQLRDAIINSSLDVGNLNLSGNTLSSIDTNGDVNIYPDGTGRVKVGDSGVTSAMRGLITNGPASDLSWNGAGMHHFTASDLAYPTKQFLNTAHDATAEVYDAYLAGINWISSDAGSNFMIQKGGDLLRMATNSGTSAGANLTWAYFWRADTSGAVTKPLQPFFNVYRSGNLINVVGASNSYTIPYNIIRDKTNITFNTGTGIATILVAGKYTFVAAVELGGIGNTNTHCYFSLHTSNKEYRGHQESGWQNKSVSLTLARTVTATAVDMDVGDIAYIGAWSNGSVVVDVTGTSQVTWFTGIMDA